MPGKNGAGLPNPPPCAFAVRSCRPHAGAPSVPHARLFCPECSGSGRVLARPRAVKGGALRAGARYFRFLSTNALVRPARHPAMAPMPTAMNRFSVTPKIWLKAPRAPPIRMPLVTRSLTPIHLPECARESGRLFLCAKAIVRARPDRGRASFVLRYKFLDNDALFPHTISHLNCKRRIARFSRQLSELLLLVACFFTF